MQIEYYVATNGKDNNDGSFEYPFASLKKAKFFARKDIEKGNIPIINLRKGRYYSTNISDFSNLDSGEKDNSVIYRAYNTENVSISANVLLKKSLFEKIVSGSDCYNILPKSSRDFVYKIDLSKATDYDGNAILPEDVSELHLFENSKSFFNIYQNGVSLTAARYPKVANKDRFDVDSWDTIKEKTAENKFIPENGNTHSWKKSNSAYVHSCFGYNNVDLIIPVKEYTTDGEIILCENPSTGITAVQPYYIMNVLSELSEPGEFFFDEKNLYLYIFPYDNSLENLEITSFKDDSLISMKDTSFIEFNNINFEGGRTAILSLKGCSDITFNNCKLRNGVGHGAFVNGNNVILNGCEIFDLGLAGVVLSGGDRSKLISSGNIVKNCHIHDYALFGMNGNAAVTMIGLESCGHTIIHNKINHAPQQAIYIGGNNHTIEYNEIYDVCRFTSDAGAIYGARDWSYRGNVIRYNIISDIIPTLPKQPDAGAIAVYLDDCLSGVVVEGNIFSNGTSAAVMSNGGRDNKIENNVIIDFWRGLWSSHTGASENDTGHFGGVNNIPGNTWNLLERMHMSNIEYKKEPWASAYPELACIPDDYYQIRVKNPDGSTSPTHWLYNENCSFKNNIACGEWKKGWLVCASDRESLKYYDGINNNLFELTYDDINFSNKKLKINFKNEKIKHLGFKKIPVDIIGIMN